MTLILFLTALLLVSAQCIARAPLPFCASKPLYKQFPLTIGEIMSYDMATAFTGYNLDVELVSGNTFANMTKKFMLLDQRNNYFPNIISHFVEPNGNTVGKDTFILYKDAMGTTVYLNYGILKSDKALPDGISTTIVTIDSEMQCFDAALFLDHGLAIVDCMKTEKKAFSRLTNYFIIIDLTTHTVKGQIANDMYVPFSLVKRRKMMKFTHPEAGGFTYLLRTYFADGVDSNNADNTYMEIFSVPVADPTQLQVIRVIDRTFIGLPSMRITDAQLYLDDIFVLDELSGLYRMDIRTSQRVEVIGRYRTTGFTKFAVYSDDLEDELLIALSNKHTINEIDWHNMNQPVLIKSYSLMENSTVKQILMNDRYIVVQSSADAMNQTVPSFKVDYTWIFSKNSRAFSAAYFVINHNSSKVEIELDRQKSRLYLADQAGLSLYEINEARLSLQFNDQGRLNKNEDVTVIATSMDYYTNKTAKCQEVFKVTFVQPENMTIWPTGIDVTDIYSVNYPGTLDIFFSDYYLGPNLQYRVVDKNDQIIPQSWINKVNKTGVKFVNPPKPAEIAFFHTDVVDELGREVVIYYFQDIFNKTSVADCVHIWFRQEMQCSIQASYNHTSKISSFATGYYFDQLQFNYDYIVVFEGNRKIVNIYDFMRHKVVSTITYEGDLEAEVTSIASSNGYLFVLRRYLKTIDVYDLRVCEEAGTCKKDFSIDSSTLKPLGVYYFAPEEIITDRAHPEVLFIKCIGVLVLLDVDNKKHLHVLDQITNDVTNDRYFRVAVNRDRLVLVAQPNLIYEYSLEHIYTLNSVSLVKMLPTYGHVIQPNADIQFSDMSNTVYVNVMNPTLNISAILVYRVGFPAANALYSIINLDKLYSRPGFEIEVSGGFVDFVSIIAGQQFMCYRVFAFPFLTINNTFFNYSFAISVKNKEQIVVSKDINVTVTSFPQKVTPTNTLNTTILKLKSTGQFQFEDRQWFTGGVVNYTYSCDECGEKVKVREHIDNIQNLQVGGNSYTETFRGGISVHHDLYHFRPNGSVYEVINLPDQKTNEECLRVAATFEETFAVTACNYRGVGIQLYVTSLASYKAFTWGPYSTDAYNARSIQIVNDIIMLVDTPENPEYFFRMGAIFLYRASFNHATGEEMNELEVFDSKDFVTCPGWEQEEAYLGNAHLLYASDTNSYRLYIVQLTSGLFVVDFTRAADSDTDVSVISTTFINLNDILSKNDLHMPNDACFMAVTFSSVKANPHFDTENVIVTTRGYHNFQFTIVYNLDGQYLSTVLHRVYYRYAFYEAYNQVSASTGFMAVGYTLPSLYANSGYPRHYIAVYDTLDYPSDAEKGYSARSILAAYPLSSSSAAMFAFNTTFDYQTNGTRIGLVVGLPSVNSLISASLAHNLSFALSPGFKTQKIRMSAYNDVSNYTFDVALQAVIPPDDDDNTFLIIIIVICVVIIVAFGFYIFKVTTRKPIDQVRQSLITDNERSVLQPPMTASGRVSCSSSSQNSLSSQEEEQSHIDHPVTNQVYQPPTVVRPPLPPFIPVQQPTGGIQPPRQPIATEVPQVVQPLVQQAAVDPVAVAVDPIAVEPVAVEPVAVEPVAVELISVPVVANPPPAEGPSAAEALIADPEGEAPA